MQPQTVKDPVPVGPLEDERIERDEAVKRIERKRKFWYQTLAGGVAMVLLSVIWALTEFQNAGGWPTAGFSQSSSIPHVWNMWILYPVIAWLFFTVIYGISVYMRKPISESDIQRELGRSK